jgi:UDP-GlcNAc:undecaprenyl-phosphate GlcNAc-1-phosphate transferase
MRILVDVTTEEVRGDFSTGILLAAGLGALGLIDDIRPLPRVVRLGAQIAVAWGAWEAGFRAVPTDSTTLNFILTLFWIVGITNAFNLLDNMDGLSAGLAGVGALSFTTMGVVEDLGVLAIVAGALTGAAFGFLIHNRHPATVFMGDSGSLFLGFMLALIGIEMRFDNLVEVTFLVPVVVLGLPIFDTTLVVLSRLRRKRSPFMGGRDHISHRLVKMGLPVGFSVGLLYWTGLCLGWLGIVISRSSTEVGWMLLGFVLALATFFGILLSRVPIYEDGPGPTPHTHQEAEALDQLEPATPARTG